MSTPHAAELPLLAETEFDEAEILRQMVDIIVREADPAAIILFGSRARGDASADSDVDLLIIEREPFGPGRSRIQEAARLYRALGEMPVSKDLLLYTRAEADRWRGSLNHVVARGGCTGVARRSGAVWKALSRRLRYCGWQGGISPRWKRWPGWRRSPT